MRAKIRYRLRQEYLNDTQPSINDKRPRTRDKYESKRLAEGKPDVDVGVDVDADIDVGLPTVGRAVGSSQTSGVAFAPYSCLSACFCPLWFLRTE